MASWRDVASQQAQVDLDTLLGAALELAQRQKDKRGELYPFSLVMENSGERRVVTPQTVYAPTDSARVLTSLLATLTMQKDTLRAIAVVADIRLPKNAGEGIRVTLEHSEHIAINVVLPYHHRRFGRAVEYGNLEAGIAPAFIWSAN